MVHRALGAVPTDVPVQVVAVNGAPGPALVDVAHRDDDMIVVGDAQRRGLRRLRSGRVARHCVRHAVCPVLVVPPPVLARASAADVTREAQRLIDAA
jgi:nucleotide-binding universal stress UspA family protein